MAMEVQRGQGAVENRSRRSRPWVRLIFFLVLAAVSTFFHLEKHRWQKQALSAREQSDLTARATEFEKVKALRGRFYETGYYLGYAWKSSYAVADFISRLNGVARPGRILDLQIDPGMRDFNFSLTVGLTAAAREPALQAFAAFRQRLQDFPEITRISFSESTPAGKGGNGGRVYLFSVSGQVEI